MSRRKAEEVIPGLGQHHDGDFGVYMAHKQAKLHMQFARDYGYVMSNYLRGKELTLSRVQG